jgi:hypothetical protein
MLPGKRLQAGRFCRRTRAALGLAAAVLAGAGDGGADGATCLADLAPGAAGDFGFAVALGADLAAVGAPAATRVHVFSRRSEGRGWQHLTSLAAEPDSVFAHIGFGHGYSLAVDGRTIAVGAYAETQAPPPGLPLFRSSVGVHFAGAVEVCELRGDRVNEFAAQGLVAEPLAPPFLTGFEVAVSGSRAAVAARREIEPGFWAGAVLLFRREDATRLWKPAATIEAPAGANVQNFGVSVALLADTLVAGAPYDRPTGAAYLYDLTRPGVPTRLAVSGEHWPGRQGGRVALTPDVVAFAGYPPSTVDGRRSGTGVAGDLQVIEHLGGRLAAEGDTLLIGPAVLPEPGDSRPYQQGAWLVRADRLPIGGGALHEIRLDCPSLQRPTGFRVALTRDAALVAAVSPLDRGGWAGCAALLEGDARESVVDRPRTTIRCPR